MDSVSAHCPLCIQTPNKHAAFIFLDMDGVMVNRQQRMHSISQTQLEKFWENPNNLETRIAAAHHLDETAVQSLKGLIEKIEKVKPVYIVLSSAWREDGTVDEIKNQIFGLPGLEMFQERIIGKTPSPKGNSWAVETDKYFQKCPEKNRTHFEDLALEKYGLHFRCRAGEIAFWLAFHQLEDCDFIVIDDDYDQRLDHFKERFIPVKMLSPSDVEKAMQVIFQWSKPSGWCETTIKKRDKQKIQTLLPHRFIYLNDWIYYSDKEIGLDLALYLAKKTAKIITKFLTSKGHLKKSIRPKYKSEPTEFPKVNEVTKFTEETRKFLLDHFHQALKEEKSEVSISVDTLPKGDLEKLLQLAGISEKTHAQYGSYFPLGMKIKFEHILKSGGGGVFKCLMDFDDC